MLPPPIRPTWTVICLECSHLLQQVFHSPPALPSGFPRSARAAQMHLQANAEMVSITVEGAKLSLPIDHASSHGCPFVTLTGWFLRCILTMHVAEPVLGQEIVTVRIRRFAALTGVARVPVEHQVLRLHGLQRPSCFGAVSGIA